jgi:hypothetical protein
VHLTGDRAESSPPEVGAPPLQLGVLGQTRVFWRPRPDLSDQPSDPDHPDSEHAGAVREISAAFQPRTRELLVYLARTDSLYFTMTVFATVGFGDISATSEVARIAVMAQMILDLLVLGLLVKVFLNAVELGREQQAPKQDTGPA